MEHEERSVRLASASPPLVASADGTVIDLRGSRYEQVCARRHEPLGEQLRALEASVFESAFGLDRAAHAAHYDPADDASIFFGVLDRFLGRPVAVARVVLPGPWGLLSARDMGEVWGMDLGAVARPGGIAVDLDTTWDLATLAVTPEARRLAPATALYQSLGMAARHSGATGMLAIFDLHVERMFARRLPQAFRRYDVPPRPFLGSQSVPVYCDLVDGPPRWARTFPDLYRWMFEGAPSPEVVPTDWASVVRRVKESWSPSPR